VLGALAVAAYGRIDTERLAQMIFADPTLHRGIEAARQGLRAAGQMTRTRVGARQRTGLGPRRDGCTAMFATGRAAPDRPWVLGSLRLHRGAIPATPEGTARPMALFAWRVAALTLPAMFAASRDVRLAARLKFTRRLPRQLLYVTDCVLRGAFT
jgi:hypothetical protein